VSTETIVHSEFNEVPLTSGRCVIRQAGPVKDEVISEENFFFSTFYHISWVVSGRCLPNVGGL